MYATWRPCITMTALLRSIKLCDDKRYSQSHPHRDHSALSKIQLLPAYHIESTTYRLPVDSSGYITLRDEKLSKTGRSMFGARLRSWGPVSKCIGGLAPVLLALPSLYAYPSAAWTFLPHFLRADDFLNGFVDM